MRHSTPFRVFFAGSLIRVYAPYHWGGGNGKNIFGLKCLVSLADSGRRRPPPRFSP